MTWRKKKSWCSRGTEGEQLGFVFCSPGPELLANSAKATGGEDVTCRSSVCVDVTSSPSPRSPRGKTPAGQTLLDNSSVGNTHFPWIAGAEKEGRAAEPAGEGWCDRGLGVCLLCVAFHSMKLEYSLWVWSNGLVRGGDRWSFQRFDLENIWNRTTL